MFNTGRSEHPWLVLDYMFQIQLNFNQSNFMVNATSLTSMNEFVLVH